LITDEDNDYDDDDDDHERRSVNRPRMIIPAGVIVSENENKNVT